MTNFLLKPFFFILVFTTCLFSFSCKKEKTTWDTEVKAPISRAEMGLDNILQSHLIQAQADSSLSLVFEYDLASTSANDAFNFPDTTVEFGSSLKTLDFPDDSASQSISLGAIAEAGGFGLLIASLQGQIINFPAMNNIVVAPIKIDNSNVFESIDVKTGTLELTVTNGLPVEITSANIAISNESPLQLIGSTSYNNVLPNQTVVKTIPLDGKTISAKLLATITGLKTAASTAPIKIDTNNTITTKVVLKDIVPNSATAIWPAQDLVDTTSFILLPSENGVMLKEMEVKEGDIEIEVFSSLQDTMYVTYTVPNLQLNGKSFVAETVVPPATAGTTVSAKQSFSFSGYLFKFNGYGIEGEFGKDLNGNGSTAEPDTVNAYVQNTKIRMQYTGVMKPLSQSDTVFIKAKITNVKPYFASGYIGKDTIDVAPTTTNFPLFNGHLSGKLKLEDVKMNISIDNGIGAEAQFQIQKISGKSSANSSSVDLSGSMASGLHIAPSGQKSNTPTSPVIPGTTSLTFDQSNSNVNDFISNLPNELVYSVQAVLNPNLPPPSYTSVISNPPNFVYDGQGFESKINMEVPLSMIADNLTLVDTMDFSFPSTASSFESADFTLAIENGFGFDATVSLIMLNANGTATDTLLSNGFITKGKTDPSTGKTVSKTKSLIHFEVNVPKMVMLKNTSSLKVILKAHTYSLTENSKKFHKIYSSDHFKVKLIGRTVYQVNF